MGCDWIRRYIKFHAMRSREDLQPAEAKMELFLSDLAVNGMKLTRCFAVEFDRPDPFAHPSAKAPPLYPVSFQFILKRYRR